MSDQVKGSKKMTLRIPAALERRIFCAARAVGRDPRQLVCDLVAACMDDLREVRENGADGVETLLGMVATATDEAGRRFRDRIAEIIEGETRWEMSEEWELYGKGEAE